MNPFEGHKVYYASRAYGMIELVIPDDEPDEFFEKCWDEYKRNDERVSNAVALLDAVFDPESVMRMEGVGHVRYSPTYKGRAYLLDLRLPTINGHTIF